jgi:hypothetical protein
LAREAFVRIRIRSIHLEWGRIEWGRIERGRIERVQLVGAARRVVIASAEARLVA